MDNAEDVASSIPKDSYMENYKIIQTKPAFEFSTPSKSITTSSSPDKATTSSVEDCLNEIYNERPSLLLFPPKLDDDQVSMSDSQILMMDDDGARTAVSPQVSPMSPEHTPDVEQRRETDLDKYDLSTLLERYKTHNEKSTNMKKSQPGIKEVKSFTIQLTVITSNTV